MNGEELVAKILAECKYDGSNRNDSYQYYRGVGAALDVVKRELNVVSPTPVSPEPITVTLEKAKKKKNQELGTPGSPYDSKE